MTFFSIQSKVGDHHFNRVRLLAGCFRGQTIQSFCLTGMVLLSQFVLPSTLSAEQSERPNFVVIMADDLGYGDISCFGAPPYQTPNLDRLATEGMKLTDFHSNGPVCSPTRAALLTGRYQQRAGLGEVVFAHPKQNRHHGLQTREVTFAERLREAGYKTGIVGKWHLGYERQYNPVRNGFDHFVGYVSGNVCYQSHLDRMGIADWWHDDQLVQEEGYCTHLITKHALKFIEEHQQKRFCLYVAHECVHSPFQGPNDPPLRREGQVGDIAAAKVKDISRAYKEMMIEMDHGVGEIVDKLRSLGLDQNTLVLFFSDNGATSQGSNAPWKGYKSSLWEGGHRVPFIAWQPGKIAAGTSSATTAMTMDIMPTLLELAGSETAQELPLDGVSLLPVLHHQRSLPQRTLFWSYRENWAVRQGDWKLVQTKKRKLPSQLQLFDMAKDPQETNDLSKRQPDLVRSMKLKFIDWKKEIDATATQQPDR